MRPILVREAALSAVAVAFLQLVLSLYYWLESPSLAKMLAPTWELLGLIVLVVAGSWAVERFHLRARARTAAPWLAGVLTALLFAFFLLGLAQGFARREFGYDVVLALHLPYVPELFRMMYNAESFGMFLVYTSLLALAVALVIAGIYLAARQIVQQASTSMMHRLGLLAGVGCYVALAVPFVGIWAPIAPVMARQADIAMNLEARVGETGRSMALETAWIKRRNPFAELKHRPSIYIFIIESYGQALYTDEDFGPFPKLAARDEERLRQAGFAIRSRYVTAPVFGGSSWMSDMALLCGVRVFNQQRFESLSTSNLRCMSHLLGDAGYRTVLTMPNTTRLEYKSTGFLEFDQVFYRDNMEYKGPRIGWGFMPDQYTMHFVHDREISKKKADQPLFVAVALTSSHHPWSKIPRYIDDWDSIGDGKIYERRPIQQFKNTFVGGDQVKEAFLESIEYAWKVVIEYLLRTVPEDALIVIYGDHQPRKPVADMEGSWDVPIHILSRDPALVERFAAHGYTPGITPGPNEPKGGSESFLLHLFTAFSSSR